MVSFELEKCSFFKWVKILPKMDWYHYQCAILAPLGIIPIECHIRAQFVLLVTGNLFPITGNLIPVTGNTFLSPEIYFLSQEIYNQSQE